jgi:ABC-type oligopeptide transport system substrate-binding subunit
MTQQDANQKAREALVKLLDSEDEALRLNVARTILESQNWQRDET